LKESGEMAAIPEDCHRQANDLRSKDRRPGDEPCPTDQGAGLDRPEPAEFQAEAEAVEKRFTPAEPANVADDGRFDQPYGASDRGQKRGFVDLGRRMVEGDLAEHGEVVAGQA
jgi:hypothetical protein